MQLTILVDNTTTIQNLKAEAGLSIYIEDGTTNVLFDTGESSLFLETARQLGISLLETNYIVLSHGHHDHSWGLKYLLDLYAKADPLPTAPVLLAHPLAFNRRVRESQELGLDTPEDTLAHFFTLHKSSTPVWITDRLVFLGEIKRQFPFEGTQSIGQIIKASGTEADYMQDDTALVYKSGQGLVIITGCSHSGICNIVEQAKQICQEERVFSIIGGLHLRKPSAEQLNGTIDYLQKINIEKLYACHCTDQPSRIALAQLGNLCEAAVGMKLEIL